jgi:type II secretory pathway pseudopilin PulG
MPAALNRTKGFTLLEAVVACALVALVMTTLCAYVVTMHKVRAHAEALRQGAYAAQARCALFADGTIYPDLFSNAPGSTLTGNPGPATLPGDWPVQSSSETVTIAPDGQSAQLVVTYVVETAQAQTATVVATAQRWR